MTSLESSALNGLGAMTGWFCFAIISPPWAPSDWARRKQLWDTAHEDRNELSNNMYAVVFRAEINELDSAYTETALRMRELALNEYGCTEFISSTESGSEIAISYWPSLEAIQAWKDDPEHRRAQELGKSKWYKSYQVQVVEILREVLAK